MRILTLLVVLTGCDDLIDEIEAEIDAAEVSTLNVQPTPAPEPTVASVPTVSKGKPDYPATKATCQPEHPHLIWGCDAAVKAEPGMPMGDGMVFEADWDSADNPFKVCKQQGNCFVAVCSKTPLPKTTADIAWQAGDHFDAKSDMPGHNPFRVEAADDMLVINAHGNNFNDTMTWKDGTVKVTARHGSGSVFEPFYTATCPADARLDILETLTDG